MKSRLLLGTALGAALALGACTAAEVSEGQSLVDDGKLILSDLEATSLLPASVETTAGLVITGLQALVTSVGEAVTSGASDEVTAISALTAAIRQVQANSTNATVQSDATAALAALDSLSTNSDETLQAQAEAAAGAVLIDYLEANAPASAAAGGSPSSIQSLIAKARARIAALRAAG